MPETLLILHVKGTEAETTQLPKEAVRAAISQGELTQSQLIWSPLENAWKQVREMPDLLPGERLILHVKGTEAETTELPKQAVRAAVSQGKLTLSQLIWRPSENSWKQVREMPDLLPGERLILHVKGTEAETTELPKQAVRVAVSQGKLTLSQLIWSPSENSWKQVREMPDLLPGERLILHVKGTEAETTELPKNVVRAAISKGELSHSQLIWSAPDHSWKQVRDLPNLLPSQRLAPAPSREGSVSIPLAADSIIPESPHGPVARAVAVAGAPPRVRVAGFTPTPRVHAAEAATPRVHAAVAVTSRVHVAEAVTPRVHVAAAATPRVHVAEVATPRVHAAAAATPRVRVAEVATPRVHVAAAATPRVHVAEVATPRVQAPEGEGSPPVRVAAADAVPRVRAVESSDAPRVHVAQPQPIAQVFAAEPERVPSVQVDEPEALAANAAQSDPHMQAIEPDPAPPVKATEPIPAPDHAVESAPPFHPPDAEVEITPQVHAEAASPIAPAPEIAAPTQAESNVTVPTIPVAKFEPHPQVAAPELEAIPLVRVPLQVVPSDFRVADSDIAPPVRVAVSGVAPPARITDVTAPPRVRVAEPAVRPQVRVTPITGGPQVSTAAAPSAQEPSVSASVVARPRSTQNLTVKEDDSSHPLKWICIGLGVLIFLVVGGNYLLVDRPLTSNLGQTSFSQVTVYAHLGAYVQPGELVIHVPVSSAITSDNFPDFLAALAHSTPPSPITGSLFDRVALTSGWTAQYSFSGSDWKQLGRMEQKGRGQRKEFLLATMDDASGHSLMPEPSLNEDARQVKIDRVWDDFVSKFAAKP